MTDPSLGPTCKSLQESVGIGSELLQEVAGRKNSAEEVAIQGTELHLVTTEDTGRNDKMEPCPTSGESTSTAGGLLKAVPVHLVVQGPHADAEELGGPF